MIDSLMFWNEPNNKSHWNIFIDPEWKIFAEMVKIASKAVANENPSLLKVLGGISPIDPEFIKNMKKQKVLENMDAIAVHGFPLDWNNWNIYEWPSKLDSIKKETELPVWITEIGASSFGAEEIQDFGLKTSATLLMGKSPRIFWYSLNDLPIAWPATTRHKESEGSAYYRHFYMGLVDENGRKKQAFEIFKNCTPGFGICQWFHFKDHRLEESIKLLRELNVKYIRTGISWADYYRADAFEWFDKQMKALDEFTTTLTLCFTPEHLGVEKHHTSPPNNIDEYAKFCVEMVRRYTPRSNQKT